MLRNRRTNEDRYQSQLACMKPPEPPKWVIMQENEYRPCYVAGRKALFHRWANTARPVLPRGVEPDENARYFQQRNTHGIVEFEDGTVERVWPQDIQFADGGHFQEYAWLPQREGEQ